jgi:hypothetical protein
MFGLHHNIQCIVEFQPYRNLIELVHQSSKAERQFQQDIKMRRAGPSIRKLQTVQENLHQEVLVEALSTTQAGVHIQMLELLLKAKDLLHQVRGTNMQIHHLPQWDLLLRVVGFNDLCVVDVDVL